MTKRTTPSATTRKIQAYLLVGAGLETSRFGFKIANRWNSAVFESRGRIISIEEHKNGRPEFSS